MNGYVTRYISKTGKYRISRDYSENGNYAYLLEKKVWWGWKTISHGYTFDECYYELTKQI